MEVVKEEYNYVGMKWAEKREIWSRFEVGCDRGGQREGERDAGAKKRGEHEHPKGG